MQSKLRELAERWRQYSTETEAMADELISILDAEDDGGAVAFPRYRAIGFDAETNCAEMVADEEGAWVHVMDIPYARPAQPGGVSDADVEGACNEYNKKLDSFGLQDMNEDGLQYASLPCMRSALTYFASHSAEAVRDGEIEIRLFDSQWVNVVNHADCYAGMSKEDAVAKAIKLTEVEMARNFHEDKWPKKAAKEQSHE